MNNKGQALIEFVLVLPVIMMILFAIVDMGMIFTNKARLENDSYEIVELIESGKSIDEINQLYKDIDIYTTINNGYKVISIKKNVNMITPGMSKIIGDPFVIEVERVIPYET